MLIVEWAECIEAIQSHRGNREDAIRRLADLLRDSSADETGPLIALCQGDIHAEEGEQPLTDFGLFNMTKHHRPVEINTVYRELQIINNGDASQKKYRSTQLISGLDPLARKWIQRILDGKYRFGLSESVILGALQRAFGHEAIDDLKEVLEYAYNTVPNFGYITGLLRKEAFDVLRAIKPIPGIPVIPESQLRCVPPQLPELWETFGPCFVQTKHDGMRCQIHCFQNQVKVFIGRDLSDWTKRFPRLLDAVLEQVDADEAIIESELMAYDLTRHQYLPRSMFFKANAHRPIVYDVLYLNGQDWRSIPYADRHAIKKDIVRTRKPPCLLTVSDDKLITSKEELIAYEAKCREDHEEGFFMIKTTAYYQSSFSGNRSKDRVKIKAVDPIEAVIVGFWMNDKENVDTFLLSIYDDEKDEFVTVARLIAGLDEAEKKQIYEACLAFQSSEKPTRVNSKIEPQYWVKPVLIVELQLDYIYTSADHTCGLSWEGIGYGAQNVRFLSANIRSDKKPEQITKVSEFLQFRREPGLKSLGGGFGKTESVESQQLRLF